MGATDDMLGVLDYWWGIEGALEDEGADVYVTSVNCMDSTANKAAQFKQQFLQILAVTGKPKANIIAHSHGTLYTRYAISNLGLSSKVASYTSLCGPHRGSAVADVIIDILPDAGEWLVGTALDIIYALLMGDSSPDSVQNAYDVSRPFMNNVFNPNTPNMAGVYYQSWATKIKYLTADLVLEPTWLLLNFYEGSNDGLVSVTSAQWGNFRGVVEGAWWCGGVSHINAINHFFGITPGFDAPAFYVDIASELRDKGY
jgi:triacylglycerol lipase